MIAVDTSVAVPAVSAWHEAHEVCRQVAAGASIPGHAFVETFSVLTRLPAPHRLAPSRAALLVRGFFPPDRVLDQPPDLTPNLVDICGTMGIIGGAVYDALIGVTAREHRATLRTRDRRALGNYERLEVDAELIP